VEDEIERLRAYRKAYKGEMKAFLDCRTRTEEKALRDDWKRRYSKVTSNQLVRLSRDRDARMKVSRWDVDDFDRMKTPQ
jgi:hypothetical protein